MKVVIPKGEIVSARLFDVGVYKELSKQRNNDRKNQGNYSPP